MSAAGCYRSDLRSQLLERSSGFRRERLAQDFAMLGFGRAPVLGGAQFQPGDDLLVDLSDDQLSQLDLAITLHLSRPHHAIHHNFIKIEITLCPSIVA
jgi:hypothetical protein